MAGTVMLTACAGPAPTKPSPTPAAAHRSPQPSSSPTPAPLFTLTDQAGQVKCPPHSPRSAQCFHITITGTSASFGTVTSGKWLDVEVPSGTLQCGRPSHYTEKLTTARGALAARATGPRLCVGAVGTIRRGYTVIHATGALKNLDGHGTITLTILASGATEAWSKPSP